MNPDSQIARVLLYASGKGPAKLQNIWNKDTNDATAKTPAKYFAGVLAVASQIRSSNNVCSVVPFRLESL